MENSEIFPDIRIRKITLTNFRNIIHAEVEIPGGKLSEFTAGEPSVLGLYGQNGSGKTSLLLAIAALKAALCGDEFIYSNFASCIKVGCENARLEFEFSAFNKKGAAFDIYYGFSLAVNDNEPDTKSIRDDLEIDDALDYMGIEKIFSDKGNEKISEYFRPKDKRIRVYDEILQYASISEEGKKSNKQLLIDTSDAACKASGKAFGNKSKYLQLTTNCDSNIDEHLYIAKIEASLRSTSFIFSPKVVKSLINGSSKVSHKLVLRSLAEFGDNYLFVILMDTTAQNNMKILPLSLWINEKENGASGLLYPLMLFEHCKILEELFPYVSVAIDAISKVIAEIVPNLHIEIEDVGKTISKGGQEIHLFDLVSVRNGVRIPLVYESDGIRRIISFLSAMIAAYNNPSVTVAIDEIDAGIFEYMLGELLAIMKESSKGQLIFTSHNLRPLEVLSYRNLLFTTVNPNNRFTKLEGISGNNNLRDSYFRSIMLGCGKDAFYDATDTFNIEQALFEAGSPLEEE